MNKFYATIDANGTSIEAGADISSFNSRKDAVEWLTDMFGKLACGETLEIVDGEYGDCWTRMLHKPVVGDPHLSPFTYNQIIIQEPGSHPGGREWWLTPFPRVLVAIINHEH